MLIVFLFVSCLVALYCLVENFHVVCACLLLDDIWWFGVAFIQVLINTPTYTSLEYRVADVFTVMPLCQLRSCQPPQPHLMDRVGQVLHWQLPEARARHLPRQHTGLPPSCAPWLRRLDRRRLERGMAALSRAREAGTPFIKPPLCVANDLQSQHLQQAIFRKHGRSSESLPSDESTVAYP